MRVVVRERKKERVVSYSIIFLLTKMLKNETRPIKIHGFDVIDGFGVTNVSFHFLLTEIAI